MLGEAKTRSYIHHVVKLKIKVMIKINDLVSVFQFGTDTFKVKRIQGNNVLIQGANKATTTVHIDDCMKKTFKVIA
tara:strand:- start:115 stop:342 length:228 start_codon:yes stop_codon:yes gene_type:complete